MPSARPRAQPLKPAPPKNAPPEVVDPRWLIQAIAITVFAALLCAYGTLCLLYYQGQWQFLLHPSHTVDRTPASVGIGYQEVRFAASQTGQPQLTGWWISATPDPQTGDAPAYSGLTVLYLHDGSGSLSDTVPVLALLHQTGLNVFAIDYRGYGASDSSAHPNAARMAEDAESALDYLSSTRHLPVRTVIPWGSGLGGALATTMAAAHPELPAVVLDNPVPDPAAAARAAHPSRVVPVRLLFGHRFDIAGPIKTLPTPKLLISGGPFSQKGERSGLQALFQSAASPKFAITLDASNQPRDYEAALRRFLDQYVASR